MENNNETFSAPVNALTGKAYQGGNVTELVGAMIEGGYSDPRFFTYRQAIEMGRVVRKGQKAAARVTRWFPVDEREAKKSDKKKSTKKEKRGRMGSKSWAVFNYEQTEVLTEEAKAEMEARAAEKAARLIAA